jgi:hypothetical protein
MLLFSTVLFVDGHPVGYKVFENNKDVIQLTPVENPHRHLVPPQLSAFLINGHWLVKGTDNNDLVEQVREDIQLFSGLVENTCFS